MWICIILVTMAKTSGSSAMLMINLAGEPSIARPRHVRNFAGPFARVIRQRSWIFDYIVKARQFGDTICSVVNRGASRIQLRHVVCFITSLPMLRQTCTPLSAFNKKREKERDTMWYPASCWTHLSTFCYARRFVYGIENLSIRAGKTRWSSRWSDRGVVDRIFSIFSN